MARRSDPSNSPRKRPAKTVAGSRASSERGPWLWVGLGLFLMAACLLVAGLLAMRGTPDERPSALRVRAETAAEAGRWEDALVLWRHVNRSPLADAASYRGEGRACLALGQAAKAEAALIRASELDPAPPEPWLMRLEIARMEDRPLDALAITKAAWEVVSAPSQRSLAQALTLALLAGAPEHLARETLSRWIKADPNDLDARAALERQLSLNTEPDDPPLETRIAELEVILLEHPDHAGIREALLLDLAEQGDFERGRVVLEAWPTSERDARYERLAGRWDLDYDQKPESAVTHFRTALDDLPFDWKTHYRLARALQATNQTEAARRAAVELGRLRERLEPVRLGRLLEERLGRLDEPASRRSLADLCASVGLEALANYWRQDSEAPSAVQESGSKPSQELLKFPPVPPLRHR